MLVCGALALALPLTALATTITNRVSASLTHVGKPGRTKLAIQLNGRTDYDQRVSSPLCHPCTIAVVPPGRSALRVLDLESDGQPDVVLGLFTGGAHCCFVDQVYRFDPATTTYVKIEHNFLDSGAALRQLASGWEFVAADSRIADWGFTDFAHSGAPIQIWQVQAGKFVNVTRQYPTKIETDAARWLRAFRHNRANDVGFIAAWAADEDLLGNYSLVHSTLAADARQGLFHSSLGLPHKSQTAFVSNLEKVLRHLGYGS
jgi:hypothetical protein